MPETGFGKLQINTRAIKWIALISMLSDHVAKLLFRNLTLLNWDSPAVNALLHATGFSNLIDAMTYFGRLAFPLFIFLLVEGFFLTRNRWKYLRRVFLFALISEIPFDFGFRPVTLTQSALRFLEFSYQNVLFTLSLGLLAMILIDLILNRFGTGSPISVLTVLIAIGAIWLGNVLETDYHAYGVAAILLAFAIRHVGTRYIRTQNTGTPTDAVGQTDSHFSENNKKTISILPVSWRVLEMALLIIPLITLSTKEAWAFVDVALIALYNGRRGKNVHKWFFYAFYPAHLLCIVLIRTLLIR